MRTFPVPQREEAAEVSKRMEGLGNTGGVWGMGIELVRLGQAR